MISSADIIHSHQHEQYSGQKEDEASEGAGDVGYTDEEHGHEEHVAIVHQISPRLQLWPSHHQSTCRGREGGREV